MKQTIRQSQKNFLNLTTSIRNQINLLSLSGKDVRSQLDSLIDEFCDKDKEKVFNYFKDVILVDKYSKFFVNNGDINKDIFFTDKDLRKTLLEQFYQLKLEEYEILIGEYLIDSIMENGRLENEIDFNDIQSLIRETYSKKIETGVIEKILFKIQNLDPVGCGFRSINESLAIQLEYLEIDQEIKVILKTKLESISKGEIEIGFLSVKEKSILKQLSFQPGLMVGSYDQNYITPDVIAYKSDTSWQIALNDSFMPKSVIDKIKNSVESSPLKTKKDAKSFLKGYERRQETLLKVSDYLVKNQSNFLNEKGSLVPISLNDVADSINVSESTISRIVKSKYLQLPQRIISLKELLEKRVNSRHQQEEKISPSRLMNLIKKVINKEDKSKPLSDEKIRLFIKKNYKVNVARRTISKYRRQAKILTKQKRVTI